MRDDDRPSVDFVDITPLDADRCEPRPVGGVRAQHRPAFTGGVRGVALVSAVLIGVLIAVVIARRHDGPATASGVATPAPSSAAGVREVAASPAPPDSRTLTNYPAKTVDAAVRQLCRPLVTCAGTSNDPGYVTAARAALGRTLDLRQLTLTRGPSDTRGVIIAALLPDGVEILVVVGRPGFDLDVGRLRVDGPFAVQSQDNQRSRVVVVGSGTVSAVAVLSRPLVQRWLGGLAL